MTGDLQWADRMAKLYLILLKYCKTFDSPWFLKQNIQISQSSKLYNRLTGNLLEVEETFFVFRQFYVESGLLYIYIYRERERESHGD